MPSRSTGFGSEIFQRTYFLLKLSCSLRVPPPLFWLLLNLEDGLVDRLKIFTTDRAHKIMRHVFEKKKIRTGFPIFFFKLLFSMRPHLATVRPNQTLSEWAENFSADTYDYISEVILSIFKNLTFFHFYKNNTKRFLTEPIFWLVKRYKLGWRGQKWKRPI